MPSKNTGPSHRSHSTSQTRLERDRGEPSVSKPKALPEFQAYEAEEVFGMLLPEIQAALRQSGYEVPTPVQEQCIPHLVQGKDLLGSAQTGTGKTAAFALPLIQALVNRPKPLKSRHPRVLILAPTRELAAQIGDSIETYGKFLNIRHAVIFGGVGQYAQEQAMNKGVDVLVATPGRLLDLMGQRFVRLDDIEAFVLDEADRMLDMGFIHDVRRVIATLPQQRQSLFFSATMSSEIVSLAGTMLKQPVRVTIEPEQPTVEKIQQRVMFVDKDRKDALLKSLLTQPEMEKVIIFVQRKHVANQVAKRLEVAGIRASVIHGNKSQSARTAALEGFRKGQVQALVATDIAARGIDVDGISHVINYELPMEAESYVHRIGRTARAGNQGDAISFCMASERSQLKQIERFIRKSIPVDRDHAEVSMTAERATGAESRPEPRGGGRSGGGSSSKAFHSSASSRGGESPKKKKVVVNMQGNPVKPKGRFMSRRPRS